MNKIPMTLEGYEKLQVELKKLIRLSDQYRLNNQVRFIDKCKQMPVAYKISDIIVSPSTKPESFGRIAVEAQSMKKPILASDLGGSKETIIDGKSGFLFKNNNTNSLAELLNSIIEMDKSKLQSIGNEGRKNVLKKFDVEKMCQTTFTEYQKLLKN